MAAAIILTFTAGHASAGVAGTYEEMAFPQSCGIFGNFGALVCSATVIGPDRALSAAHCFPNGDLQEPLKGVGRPWYLRCGHSPKIHPIALAVRETPPDGNSILNDRALILIKGEPFEAPPLPIAAKALLEPFREPGSRDCVFAGWGQDNANHAGALNVVRMDRVELNKRDLLEYGFGRNEALPGDSGGTLACRFNGEWRLVGVHHGTPEMLPRDVGVTAEIPARLRSRFEEEVEKRRMDEINAAAMRRPEPLERVKAPE